MVSEIIDILNNSLSGLHPDAVLYGLAQTVVRTQGSETDALPGLVNKDGEIKYVGIDDIYSIIIYHKLNSLSSTPKNNGRGDNPGDLTTSFGLSMIVYWDRKRYNKLPDEVVFIAQARLPQLIKDTDDVKLIKIKVGSANFNSLQVFTQEYSGTKFDLPPNANLMNLNYTIEATFNPACLPAC